MSMNKGDTGNMFIKVIKISFLLFVLCLVGCNVSTNDVEKKTLPEAIDTMVEEEPGAEEELLFPNDIVLGINNIDLNNRRGEVYKEKGLPLINIITVDGELPTCDYVDSPTGWGAGTTNATKVPSRMTLTWGDDLLYDSGEYKKSESGLTIKIHGNTSAYSEKKPYKLKLQKKADLLEHIRKDEQDYTNKNWLLLKDTKALKTIIGLATSRMIMGSEVWIPDWEYVDVNINNTYCGCYILIESIDRNENRVNVSKNGFIIERDTYWYTEDIYFETNDQFKDYMKYTFKYPDELTTDDDGYKYISKYVQDAYDSLYLGNYEQYIDVNSFIQWVLVHDILGNEDYAGSNIYLSKYDNSTDSVLHMETPWDFDHIFESSTSFARIHATPVFFYTDLFPSINRKFKNGYIQKWDSVKTLISSELLDYINEFKQIYEDALNESREKDYEKYHDENSSGSNGYTSVNDDISEIVSWFDTRIDTLDMLISTELR